MAVDLIEPGLGYTGPKDGFLPLATPVNTASGSNPVPVDVVDGVLYGRSVSGTDLYKSLDSGATWTLVKALGAGGTINGLRKLDDGEVLLMRRTYGLYRSSGWAANPATATFTQVQAPHGISYMLPWGVDISGSVIIATEYTVPRDDSRYVYVSTDMGRTFTTVLDLTVLYPGQDSAVHWHGVAVDPWQSNRLWASHGDGPSALRYSDDLGATWTAFTFGSVVMQPTTITPTPTGVILGMDTIPDLILFVPHSTNVAQVVYTPRFDTSSIFGFPNRAWRDIDGIVYIAMQSSVAANPAFILATDGFYADEVWRATPAGATNPNIATVMVDHAGQIIAPMTLDGTAMTLVAGRSRRGAPRIQDWNSGGVLGGSAGRQALAAGMLALALSNSTAVGPGALAGTSSVGRSTALGNGANAAGDRATALGAATSAAETYAVAVGYLAGGSGTERTAVGMTAKANALSVALGKLASAQAQQSVAVGATATADQNNAVAIGYAAVAGHTGTVALGQGSTTTAANQVMVGGRDVEITDTTKGIVLVSPDGTRHRVTVSNAHALVVTAL